MASAAHHAVFPVEPVGYQILLLGVKLGRFGVEFICLYISLYIGILGCMFADLKRDALWQS